MLTKDTSVIDRKQAGRLLGVSVRTIDRYIHSGKLPAYSKGGRILLRKHDVLTYSEGEPVTTVVTPTVRQTRIATRPSVHMTTTAPQKASHDFYRDLYEESKNALTEYREKLEQANYRIGQMESRGNSHPAPQQASIPMPMYQNAYPAPATISLRSDDSNTVSEFLKKEISEREKEILMLKNTLKQEQSARTIFAILTYILLASIPALWYFSR